MNKLYLIIISEISEYSIDEVVSNIYSSHLKRSREVDFFNAQFTSGECCIGEYNGSIILVDPTNVFDFYSEDIGLFAKCIFDYFPEATLTVLSLYSVINSVGFAIIEKGKPKRVKWRDWEKVYVDYGDKIEEEMDENSSVVDLLLERYFGDNEQEVLMNLDSIKLVEYK